MTNFELRLKSLYKEKQVIQELSLEHLKLVNKLAKDLQIIGFANRQRKITKIKREINNKTKKLLELI